jgi:VWFA-related protein
MKMHWIRTTLILGLLFGSVWPVSAQGAINLSLDDLLLDALPEAQALVTVRDDHGVPIVDLGAGDFEIIEDGQASFPPSSVEAQVNPDAVISAMLVIDVSGSMEGKPIEEAMRAANTFIDQLSDQDRVAILAFGDEVNVDPTQLEEGKEIDFTNDKNALRNVINFLDAKIGWDTPLYDAIYKGVDMTSREPVGKRTIILMTDGRDERDNAQGIPVPNAGSFYAPDDPINEATKQGIPVFTIGLGGRIDSRYLSRLALRTGGVYQETPEAADLTALFQNVLDQLKQQYLLSFRSTLEEDGNYHSLMVRVQLPQGQAFDERKVRLGAEPALSEASAVVEIGRSESETKVAVAKETNQQVAPTPAPTTVIDGIRNTIEETIEDKPIVAAAIGFGALLLLGLIIALIVVLFRSRGAAEEEYYAAEPEFEDRYTPPATPSWSAEPTGPRAPAAEYPPTGEREFAPTEWAGFEAEPGPAGPPPFAQPPEAVPAGPGAPPAGGTRVIERAPKHLAMLVEKARPDRKFDLKGKMNIGRAPDNQIVLTDPTVSRHHAWIREQEGSFLVFDIGSANGTFVNGERVEAPRMLENGDTVRFGEVDLVFTKLF